MTVPNYYTMAISSNIALSPIFRCALTVAFVSFPCTVELTIFALLSSGMTSLKFNPFSSRPITHLACAARASLFQNTWSACVRLNHPRRSAVISRQAFKQASCQGKLDSISLNSHHGLQHGDYLRLRGPQAWYFRRFIPRSLGTHTYPAPPITFRLTLPCLAQAPLRQDTRRGVGRWLLRCGCGGAIRES